MSKLLDHLDHVYALEQQTIEIYGDIHAEIKAQRRAAFALANEISTNERHVDVLMQQLIRRVQDLELTVAELADQEPAHDQ